MFKILVHFRGHPRAFSEGEVLLQFQDFREKFLSKVWISLFILYIFTSPSVQDREVSQLRQTFSPKSPSKMTPAFTILTLYLRISSAKLLGGLIWSLSRSIRKHSLSSLSTITVKFWTKEIIHYYYPHNF